MIKTFVLISVMLLASSVNAVCEDDLITALGLTPTTAAALTDLDYCANLQETGAQSCCSAATINAFQTDLEATITTLEAAIATRDQLIQTARKTTVPALKAKYVTIAADAQLVLTELGSAVAYADAIPKITAMKNWNSNINTINSVAQARVAPYQAARTTCIRKLLKFQSAAWCLACDNTAATLGVTTGATTIPLSDDAYEELIDACYGYLAYAEFHSAILYYTFLDSTDLDTLIVLLNAVLDAADDAATVTAVTAVTDFYDAIPVNSNSDVTSIVEIPASCDEDACAWVEDSLFADGVLDETLMIIGGSEVSARRLLQNIANSKDRMLAGGGTWVPANTASGATISVESNPGDIDNSNGLRQGALIGSILAVLAVLLF